MRSNELKQRKKTLPHGRQQELNETTKQTGEEKEKNGKELNNLSSNGAASPCPILDFKSCICLLSIMACLALSWFVLEQNARFADVEEKYKLLHKKTTDLQQLQNEVGSISKKFEEVQYLLGRLEGRPTLLQLESLEKDVSQLKDWASGLTDKRQKLQESLSGLSQAVQYIEERTAAITRDVAAKVASVRTDVRRMSGLESDTEALLAHTRELEERVAQAERGAARRIGELLAGSIDRVGALRSSSERNSQSVERLRGRLTELEAADTELSARVQALESGRARLVKTVTFAADLKPRVSTIRRDLALLEPLLADLTVRIGRLAQDMSKREEDVALLRDTFSNLSAIQTDLCSVQKRLTQGSGMNDMSPLDPQG